MFRLDRKSRDSKRLADTVVCTDKNIYVIRFLNSISICGGKMTENN